ncbi:hypothetical protein BV20DRAFT_731437 [Pilatotrama ljubarskyi]|nr:hypothetical protein BV20DRAFT_731437 [Pilatotrama ljubarskyi]
MSTSLLMRLGPPLSNQSPSPGDPGTSSTVRESSKPSAGGSARNGKRSRQCDDEENSSTKRMRLKAADEYDGEEVGDAKCTSAETGEIAPPLHAENSVAAVPSDAQSNHRGGMSRIIEGARPRLVE